MLLIIGGTMCLRGVSEHGEESLSGEGAREAAVPPITLLAAF